MQNILIALHLKMKVHVEVHTENQYANAFLILCNFALSFLLPQQYCSGPGQGHSGQDLTDLSSSTTSSLTIISCPHCNTQVLLREVRL